MKRVKRTLIKAALMWLTLSVVPLIYYFYLSTTAHHFLLKGLEQRGEQFLSYVDTQANRTTNQLLQTFDELSHSELLLDYAKEPSARLKHYLVNQWYVTSYNSTLFYQLRYLDKEGNELIRVDYTPESPFPFIVPDSQLQSKGHRDYFRFAKQLKPGEEGMFGIDLEYEHEKPVIPYRPGLRLIMPIDTPTERLGYFIANLDVLAVIHRMTNNTQNLAVDFVDKDGFYIISSDPSKLFGDLIFERAAKNLPSDYPDLWLQLKEQPNRKGTLYNDSGLFLHQPFVNSLFSNSGTLNLVTSYPNEYIMGMFSERDNMIRSDAITIWLLLGLCSVVFSLYWETYRQIKMDRTYAEYAMENGIAIVLTDSSHTILRANSKFSDLVGISPNRLVGQNLLYFQPNKEKQKLITDSLNSTNEWQGEFVLKSPNGDEMVHQTVIKTLLNKMNRVQFFVYSFADISEHHNAIMELKEKSERDPTTSLWNKKKFDQTLAYNTRLRQRYPEQSHSCLAVLDIDSFKSINDSLGHTVGDEVIMFVAIQLKSLMRDTDFIARIGGDEFAVIIQHSNLEHAAKLMNRIRVSIASWPKHNVSISVGIAQLTEDPLVSFSNADQALYRSKRKGKNCVSIHGVEKLSLVEPRNL
ncbi:sensor domain-containing diguanylate cyclase [Vibrio tritonius]|uniref:sensor domain-containing diguanylate cyclase n=1 Tax=Vibrio tritonius TaxID=1435069 RepID=UPI00083813C7|nr:diguanylate cyclase [Vibrio tritonius]